MRATNVCALALVGCLAAGSTARADVQLTMQAGRVSLVAKDATLRQILSEWAKVGHTRIVNGDRVPGGPLTIQLTNVSEEEALDVLLRSLSGYMAAQRTTPVANQSRFDRIVVMPTTAPPPSAARASAPPAPTPQPSPVQPGGSMPFTQQLAQPNGADDDQEEDRPAPPAAPQNRGPVFNTFPQPQVVNPAAGVAPAQAPLTLPPAGGSATTPAAAPIGVSTPGMAVPVPQQPNQQAPGAPPNPRRPGGPVTPGGPGGND